MTWQNRNISTFRFLYPVEIWDALTHQTRMGGARGGGIPPESGCRMEAELKLSKDVVMNNKPPKYTKVADLLAVQINGDSQADLSADKKDLSMGYRA